MIVCNNSLSRNTSSGNRGLNSRSISKRRRISTKNLQESLFRYISHDSMQFSRHGDLIAPRILDQPFGISLPAHIHTVPSKIESCIDETSPEGLLTAYWSLDNSDTIMRPSPGPEGQIPPVSSEHIPGLHTTLSTTFSMFHSVQEHSPTNHITHHSQYEDAPSLAYFPISSSLPSVAQETLLSQDYDIPPEFPEEQFITTSCYSSDNYSLGNVQKTSHSPTFTPSFSISLTTPSTLSDAFGVSMPYSGPIKDHILDVYTDIADVVWIVFLYSKNKEVRSYSIRCDVDKVPPHCVKDEFKTLSSAVYSHINFC